MSRDAAEINRMLIERGEETCLHLLPNGKRRGIHWVVGGVSGEAGESMQITIAGSAAGRFIDFSNKDNKGATMLWLWSKVKGVTYSEAVRQAAEFLGLKPDDYGVHRHKPKIYAAPPATSYPIPSAESPVMNYLVSERKLDRAVVEKAKIGETPDSDAIIFNYADYNPEKKQWNLAHRKFIKLARPDGKKDVQTTKGTKRCLYGKNLIDDNVSEIILTEGEIDALSWHTLGIPAVSIPNGVSDMEWVDIDWDWLARFEKIYVSTDMDEPGLKAAPEICKRLGLHRCYIVALPKKDANECLVSGVTKEEMKKCLEHAKAIELDEIKSPDSFKKEVFDAYDTDPMVKGYSTPWEGGLNWKVRAGELTILSGFSGHGKTQLLNQLMVSLILQGARVMDASLEIRPGLTLYYMTRCAMAKKHPERNEIDACVNWLNDGLHFLDCIGTVNVDRIMAALEYSRKRYGTDVFIIDSLFKCGLSGDDFAGAREFADRLTTFCNNTGAHVILVAHSRKTQNGNEYNVPTKSDVAGSSDITNAAFNVIICWRNKMKKRKIDEARQTNNVAEMAEWVGMPDGKILVDKQRFGEGEEGETNVWFNKDACQFHCGSEQVIPYFKLETA